MRCAPVSLSLYAVATLLAVTGAGDAAGATDSTVPPFAFMNGGWQAVGVVFLAPPSGPGPVIDMPGRKRIGNNLDLGQPIFAMADLGNPILQPWARDALKAVNDHVAAGGGGFTAQASCKLVGVPAFLLHPAQPIYFVQTPKEVVMIWPPNAEYRHLYLTEKHSADLKPSWFGESIGHYENGDTLVVDTIGLNDKTYIDNFRTPHTIQLHVVERFRINPDGKGLTVDVAVDDPGAFTTPWHAVQRYRRVEQGPMRESSCAEAPVNYLHYDMDPIPQADRADF
ncbi:MAG TPA: hypothetical protein VFW28_08755 [Micropepsaceae bacterium]|nr:hypothetical protein [Micropepsaceae bacterium]